MWTRRKDRRQPPPRPATRSARGLDTARRAGVPPLPETEPRVWRTPSPCPALPQLQLLAESGRALQPVQPLRDGPPCSPREEGSTGLKKVQSLLQAGPSGHLQAGSRVAAGRGGQAGGWAPCALLWGFHPPDNLTQETCRPSDSVKRKQSRGTKRPTGRGCWGPLSSSQHAPGPARGCRRAWTGGPSREAGGPSRGRWRCPQG